MKESIQYILAEPKGGVVGEPWFPTLPTKVFSAIETSYENGRRFIR